MYDGRITGLIYSDDEEFYDFIGEVVPDALSRNMKVLFIFEPGKREDISSHLAEEGICCNEMISEGRLLFPAGFSRSGENLPEAGEVVRLLDYETGEAGKNGYRSLLVIADCLCLLGNSPSEEAVHRLNSSLARFIKEKKTSIICGYDKTDYSSVSFIQTIEDLERLVVGDKILDNPCHIPPDKTTGGDRDLIRIDIMLKNILDYNEYKTELQNKVRLYEERKGEVDVLLPELRRLKDIVNNSPATAFLWDASRGWPVVFVSQNISNFGYNPVDFYSGKIVFSDIIHPEDVERVAEEVKRYTEEGRVEYNQEYRILTSSGEIRWVDDRTIVHRDEDGKVLMFEGVIMDITESMELEEELRLSNEKYMTLFTMNPDVIALSNIEDGTIIDVNDRCLDLTGIPAGDWIGKKVLDLPFYINSSDRDAYVRELDENGSVKNFEVQIHSPEVGTRYVSMSGRVVEIGKERYVLTIIHDMTEQRLAQEKIIESEERFRAVSEALTDGLFVIVDNYGIVFWNKAAERMFGYTEAEVKEIDFMDDVVPERLKPGVKGVFEYLREGREHPILNNIFDFVLKRRDGEEFPVEISTVAVNIRGCWAIAAIVRDISERKKYEEELRLSAEKLRNTFDSIQDALYIIDKDFNVMNINKVLLEILGLDRSSIIGKKCYAVFRGREAPCEICPAKKSFEEKKPCRMEISGEDRFGGRRHYDAVGSPVYDDDGEPVLAIL